MQRPPALLACDGGRHPSASPGTLRSVSVNRSTQDIRREAEQLLKAAGVTGAPVVLRDVVSYLNLSLVERAREPFSSEAALVPLGEGHAIELRGTSNARRRLSSNPTTSGLAKTISSSTCAKLTALPPYLS